MARFATAKYELEVLTASGPRISHLSRPGGPNVLAELPNAGIDLADGRRFMFRGGHRLWVAPEVPERTYLPDDEPCLVQSNTGRIEATQPAASTFPIERTLGIDPGSNGISVTHRLVNRGPEPLTVAPWAITQLVTGGTAIVPLEIGRDDAHGLQANGTIVTWPYTDLNEVVFAGGLAVVNGHRRTPLKIGVPLVRGWLAYVLPDLVFVKRTDHVPEARYPDRGASGQCYGNDVFLELETLGPLVVLAPGAETTHTEWWELHERVPERDPVDAVRILELDGT